MIEFALHPNVYATGKHRGLRSLLEEIWIRSHSAGDGSFFVLSGFANYNGGARFYKTFKEHTERGGRIFAVLGGSTAQRTTSRQVAQALLDCGATLFITNRKSLMHAKCYGASTRPGDSLVVTSGNFTGPGMAQNVEAALFLGPEITGNIGFSWQSLLDNLLRQNWLIHQPDVIDQAQPVWSLLYDETPGVAPIDPTDLATIVLLLGHADTARIMARPHTNASLGTQYFWLSKDCFDFFPPLTIRNQRGYKGTLSCLVTLNYVDLGEVDTNCRVTYEAENNLDFRVGTGLLRNTRVARPGDLACISRVSDDRYELRLVPSRSPHFQVLEPFATAFIGHKGKRFGFLGNDQFETLTGYQLDAT